MPAARLSEVRAAIAKAEALARRPPGSTTLIAVSKTQPVTAIAPLIAAGQRVFGENRVQEAAAKWPALRAATPDLRLHLIGQLQSNKAPEAVALFDAIHSVDRASLIAALTKAMARAGRRPACFLQVDLGDEPQKGGCAPAALGDLLAQAHAADLPIGGLMTLPPAGVEPAPYFALLAKLARDHDVAGLSMGMSDDYPTAVTLGATWVRVGTARSARALMRDRPDRFAAILFDFDGVLIESERAGNQQIADYLTGIGHPTSLEEALERFMGLSGAQFIAALEGWIGRALPADFAAVRRAEDDRVLREGIAAVAGAVAFVRSLPPGLPRAIVSSSSTRWIAAHLAHLGLSEAFGDQLYSGKEHVAHGKPAPDLYHHAAARLGVPIADCAIIEDSAVGATGAVASGGYVIGLCAGSHCAAGHADRLRAIGVAAVAASFADVARLVSAVPPAAAVRQSRGSPQS